MPVKDKLDVPVLKTESLLSDIGIGGSSITNKAPNRGLQGNIRKENLITEITSTYTRKKI